MHEYRGREVALSMSMFYGPLYDDRERYLLTPYPFAETSDLVDVKGQPIHPEGQAGIIPAGTRFRVRTIEFAEKRVILQRMLLTPRYNPWLILELVDKDPFLPSGDKPFVIVLPYHMNKKSQVQEAIAANVGPVNELAAWLRGLQPEVLVAIKHKKVVAGMRFKEMVAAWGYPRRMTGVANKDEQAHYGQRRMVILKEQRVVEVTSSTK